ncbi:MAG: aminoglycoside phosphotransferase family protein [Patescibacteria group bacterium]
MESPETEQTSSQIMIGGVTYDKVLERQRGVGIYTNSDRSLYLRIGDRGLVSEELSFHRRLVELGFPVAKIVKEGEKGGLEYWMEESIGDHHASERFRRDVESFGEISSESFELWLGQVGAMRDAQARTSEIRTYDFDVLAKAVGEDGMEEELPDVREQIHSAWEKAEKRIADLPICLTHGDFTSHNIMERGVIDFGDHFEGPLGYDLVTAITVPFWFPNHQAYEFFQLYNFTEKQIEQYLSECRFLKTPTRTFDLNDYFDDLFFLKANWWAVQNHRMPKLQEWRYKRYRDILERYLAEDSLQEYWRRAV